MWLPGSDTIGDFTWPGLADDVVVTDGALDAMSPLSGVEPAPVEFVEDLSVLKGRAREPRVTLPYSGPPLSELWVTRYLDLDHARSTTRRLDRCELCGFERWEVEGIEVLASRWDAGRGELVEDRRPRQPGMGLYVHGGSEQADLFRVAEFPGWILCSDGVRDTITQHRLTNVGFLEVGEFLLS